MSKEETRLWSALASFIDAGFSEAQVMATAQKIGLIDAIANSVEKPL